MMKWMQSFSPETLYEQLDSSDPMGAVRHTVLQALLIVFLVFGVIAYAVAIVPAVQQQQVFSIVLYSFLLLALAAITLIRSLPHLARSLILLALLLGLATFLLIQNGLSGDGRFILLLVPVLGWFLIGRRTGILSFILCLAAWFYTAYSISTGSILSDPSAPSALVGSPVAWTVSALVFSAHVLLSIILLNFLLSGLAKGIQEQTNYKQESIEIQEQLKQDEHIQQVLPEKTPDGLDAVSRLAREITSAASSKNLLETAVKLVSEYFSSVAIQIYVTDAQKEYAILNAASGDEGPGLVEQNYRVWLKDETIIGYVISNQELRLSSDLQQEPLYKDSLPFMNAQSSLAIPLNASAQTLGVLVLLSDRIQAFLPDDIKVFQVLADQLAVAIEKNDLIEQLQKNRAELERGNKELTRQEWRSHLMETRKKYTYRYQRAILNTDAPVSPEARLAAQKGETMVSRTPEGSTAAQTVVAVPIIIRQQVLGSLDVRFDGPNIPQNTVELIESVSSRLSLAIENARLLEAIQMRAEREHTVSEITSKVRSSADIDAILQTAAGELGRALGVAEVLVQLRSGE